MKKHLLFFMLTFFSIGALNSQVGLDFDGSNDILLTDYDGVAGSASRTIEVWFKKDYGSGQMIISESGGGAANFSRFTFKLQNNHLRVEIGGGLSLEGNTYISPTNWHHGAVVYDDNAATNKYTLYLDGQIEAQGDFSGVNTTILKTSIGARSNGVGAFNGKLDEYRFWTTARTQAEIQSNMNGELCTLPTTLGAYFKFNEGTPGASNSTITNAIDEVTPLSINTLSNFSMTGVFSNYIVGEVTGGPVTYETIVSSCTPYTWTENGTTYSTSGVYEENYIAVNGCDSIIALDLTIGQATSSTITEVECDQFVWSANSMTYTTSGQYTATIPNQSGCDSVITLNLTINQSDIFATTESVCDEYVWTVNGTTYTTSGQYIESFTNQAGCDSIYTLDLTVGHTDSMEMDETACNEYVWSENGMTYTTSGQYIETFTNQSGCDSIFILNLTVTPLVSTVTNNNEGTFSADDNNANYQWFDCNTDMIIAGETSQDFTPTTNGSYAVIVDNNNCTDTSECIVIDNVGLDQNDLNLFSLYPNPSNGEFNIEFNQAFTGIIEVFDATGKVIYHANESNNTISKVNLSKIVNGIYFVKIVSETGFVNTRKVNIQ